MDVLVVRIQKIPMEHYQIYQGIIVSIGILRIASKNVVDISAIVETCWHLTICIVGGFTTGVGKSLHLKSYRGLHQPKIWVQVTRRRDRTLR